MSEYQFVHFLAIDRPLEDRQLEFMRRQSTRAEITRWDFTNEYHFGDFHGNSLEMLRRGYDVHLHYANFGTRRLMFRLPAGLPCDRRMFVVYRIEGTLDWTADKKGSAGVLEIAPEADAGTYDEDLFDVDELLPEIAPVREQLIRGDMRALYVAWLATCFDEEATEPPVPAGLGKLTPAVAALADFYEVSEDLIAAAAQRSPAMVEAAGAGEMLKTWIAKQSQERLRELVERLLSGDTAAARAETLSRVRDEMGAAAWPTANPTRTLAELRELAGAAREQRLRKENQKHAAARRKRLAAIAADPQKVITEVEKLVKTRSVDGYQEAASNLADLREALGPEAGPARSRAVAEKLRRENPRLHHLVAALRKQGFLE